MGINSSIRGIFICGMHSRKIVFFFFVDKGKFLCYNTRASEKEAMQVWYNGSTSALQAEYVGSIPITCLSYEQCDTEQQGRRKYTSVRTCARDHTATAVHDTREARRMRALRGWISIFRKRRDDRAHLDVSL